MKTAQKPLNFKALNWKAILLFGLLLFYAGLILIWSHEKASPIQYGGDYLAFWSAGKVADEYGFSSIYELQNLKKVQAQTLQELQFPSALDGTVYSVLPSPYFSIFLIPFKFLSRIEILTSYWIWVVLNLLTLAGYLVFFLSRMFHDQSIKGHNLILVLLLVSFPAFDNLVNGQLNTFLLVCCGEFIRNAVKKKPVLSGLWLGGMLLKPQVLILILPVLLLQRHWKAIGGFVLSSIAILGSSTLLSGMAGMTAYARLLTGWGDGNSVTAPEAMINWRMIATYINNFVGSPLGWIVAGIGIAITIAFVFAFLKRHVDFGSPAWVLALLGIMSASLAITWHSHAHMAIVLIPLLLYAISDNMLTENQVLVWVIMTPLAWFIFLVLGLFLQKTGGIDILSYQGMVVAFSGFFANLVILRYVSNYFGARSMRSEPLKIRE